MQKYEFEKLVGEQVNEENYAIIEKVYNYHPAISDKNGKQEIAAIFLLYNGLIIIKDMLYRAEKCMQFELIVGEKRRDYEEAQQILSQWQR